MNKGFVLLLTTTALLVPYSAGAGEKEDQLIEQVTEAYGGDKLRNLTSYIIEKAMMGPASGQSRTPQLDNLSTNTFYTALDIKNGKSRSDTLFSGRGGDFQGATIIDGDEVADLPVALLVAVELPRTITLSPCAMNSRGSKDVISMPSASLPKNCPTPAGPR